MLCAILLWPVRDSIFAQFGFYSRPPVVFRYGGQMAQRYRSWSIHNAMDVVALLNLPAGVMQLPYVIANPARTEWIPRGMDGHVWRAVTWPILGTVFWWMAGRGADGLMEARRKRLMPHLGWVETTIGFLLLAGGGTFAVGFVFFAGEDRHDLILQLLAVAATLWAVLGSLSVAGKIVQWRLRKRLAADPPP